MKLPSLEEAGFSAVGFGSAALFNLMKRRPIFSKIYMHAIGTGVGYMVGRFINNETERRAREKRIFIEDYIRLHPEDFIEPPPKYYRDVLQKWYPAR